MSQLTYLMREIGAGVEIFYSSKSGGQFWKTAFILCDNYTELASKLFLIADNPKWSDMRDKEAKKFEKAKQMWLTLKGWYDTSNSRYRASC